MISNLQIDYDDFAEKLKNELGESLVVEEEGEDDPLNWYFELNDKIGSQILTYIEIPSTGFGLKGVEKTSELIEKLAIKSQVDLLEELYTSDGSPTQIVMQMRKEIKRLKSLLCT